MNTFAISITYMSSAYGSTRGTLVNDNIATTTKAYSQPG